MSRKIEFSPPDITELEIAEVTDTLRSGWITTGPKTKSFENKIATFCGTEKAACLSSATSAMELTLRICGIGKGDEVITTPYTYTATASVIEHVGAKIVFCDTAPDSFYMDYDKLAGLINERTKAIMPVDIAGVIADHERVIAIAESKKSVFRPKGAVQKALGRIAVIADAAHSFGAIRMGRRSGNIADFTCFSFHAVKNLTTAEGGAVTWRNIEGVNNEDIYRSYMLLSLHGQSKDALAKTRLGAWEYDIVLPAYKCNMTDIQASLGIAQMQRYGEILKRRKEIITIYNKILSDCNVSLMAHYGDSHSGSGHLYLVRLNGRDSEYRNAVIAALAEKGISSNVHYKPLPMMTAYKNMGFDIKDYPNAYNMYRNEITLPLHTLLTDDDAIYVATALKEIIR